MTSQLPTDKQRDVMVVIRSTGERTETTCRLLASEQVPAEHIVVIHERPFGSAVRRTIQIGIESGLTWTLALDADILLRRNAVQEMITVAAMQPPTFFFANFCIADKLRGKVCMGGPHLYRTSLLETGLQCAGRDIDRHTRPESLVRARMALKGHPTLQFDPLVTGLHDFEQFYRDVYRTAYVHALKHPAKMMAPCLAAWERLAHHDTDFRVAALGVRAAAKNADGTICDDQRFPSSVAEIDGLGDLKEKEPLQASELTAVDISRMLGQFSPFPECIAVTNMIENARSMLRIRPAWRERVAMAARRFWSHLTQRRDHPCE